jgi:hypothetical protein
MIDPRRARQRMATGSQIAALLAMAAAGLLAASGCGSVTAAGSDGGPGGDGSILQTFLGTWTLSSGTITLTCSGLNMVSQVSGNIVWQVGTTSDLMEPADSSSTGCVLLANASGKTATALPNQTCSKGGVDLTLTGYTFVLGSTGTTATETGNGNETVTTGGVGTTCTYAESATYTKAP